MDVQDHKKTASLEHEIHGVHLCHKCGWPFPNPHPSAKHRRAHKRVCGTIEGYKLIDSELDHANLAGSDDEHLSDDEEGTPSPKVDKKSTKEIGSSGGMGLKSSRSEDDLFSDAVTDFSDNGVSPILEERLESVKLLDKNVGRELLHDLEDTLVSKDEKTADSSQPVHGLTQPPQGPGKASEMADSDVVRSERSESEITKSINVIGAENVSVGVSSTNGLGCDSSRVVSEFITVSDNSTTDSEIGKKKEPISSCLGTEIKEKEKGDEVIDVRFTAASEVLQSEHKLEIEPKLEEIEGKTSGPVVLQPMALEAGKETSDPHSGPDFQSKLNNVNGESSHAGIVDVIVSQEKELTNDLHSKHDVSSQIEPAKFEDASVVSEVESDSAKNLIRTSHGQGDEVCDLKEAGNEETHLLSAAKTLPAVENPEVMMGDFKDYKVLKSNFPLDLGAAEEISSADEVKKVSVSGNLPSALSNVPAGSVSNTSSDSLEGDLEKEGVSTPFDGEVGISVPDNLPSAPSVPAGTVDNSPSDALEDDLKEEGASTPIGGEVGTSVPVNLPSACSGVPAGTVDNSSSKALEDDLKNEVVSTPIDGEVGTSVPESLPSSLSIVPAGTVDNSSSTALEDNLKKDCISTAINGEVGSFVPETLSSALSSVPTGTVDNSSSETFEDDLRKETEATFIDGEVGSSGFRVTSDEDTHLFSVAETLPAVENPEAMIGDFKDYKVLKSSFFSDLGDAEEIRSVEDDKNVTVPENFPSALSNDPTGSVDNSLSDTLEDDVKKEAVSIPIDGEVDASGSGETSDEGTHLLSVAETAPAVDNPEVMIGEFKDYKVLKSSFPLDLGAAEEIRSVENEKKVNVPENLPSALPNVPAGSIDNSSSDALGDDLKKEGVPISIDGEIGASGFRVTDDADFGSSGLGDHPETSGSETNSSQPNNNLEGSVPQSVDGKSLQNEDSEPTTRQHSDVIPLECSAGETTWQSTNVCVGENADNHGTDRLVCVPAENGNVQEGDKLSANITTRLTHGEAIPETIEKSISLAGDDSLGHENSTLDFSNIAGNETTEVAAEEKLVKHADEVKKVLVPEKLPSALSNVPAGSVGNTSPDALEGDLEKEGVSTPIDGEVGISVPENLPSAPSVPAGTVDNSSSDAGEDGLKKGGVSMQTTWQSTNLYGGENAGNHGTDRLVCVPAENGNMQEGDELSANITARLTHGEAIPETIEKSISLAGDDSLGHENSTLDFSSIAGNETMEVAAEEKLVKHAEATHESTQQLTNLASLDKATGSNQVDIDVRDSGKLCNSSESRKCSDEIPIAFEGLKVGDETEVPRSSGTPGMLSELKYEDPTVPSEKTSENSSPKEIAAFPIQSELPNKCSASVEEMNIRDAIVLGPFVDDGKDKVTKQNFGVPAIDNSVVSSSRTDSLEGNWGSSSVLSTRSDVSAAADAEALSTDTQAAEKLDGDPKKPQAAAMECRSDKSDVFEPPSFMTLVESGVEADKNAAASEIRMARRDEQTKSEALQAGWFPSLTNVVNESEGRKKNEEIIAKVTNWSPGKQHSPLKNLLSEAHAEKKVKSPNTKQVPAINQADETASKNNDTAVTTVSSILGSEMPTAGTVKKEMEKEWNSPARYPIQIKKEKRKGKTYWVPFVCCTSVRQDV